MADMFGRSVKKRAQAAAMKAANIDTTGLDPEMAATLGQESARRIGAAGVRIETRNPLSAIAKMFAKKKAK